MKFKSIIFAFMLVFSIFLSACGAKEEQPNDTKVIEQEALTVYTTIFPLMDFTQKIGGEFVDVKSLIPIGADAHTFEPSSKTMVDVSNADLYIYNGAGIEGFADAVVEVLKSGNVKILKASEGIEIIEFSHANEDSHETDEHGHETDEHGHETDEHGHETDAHGHETDEHGHETDAHGNETDEHGHETDEHAHGEGDPHIWLDPIRSIKMAENIKNVLVELLPEESEHFESNFLTLKGQLEGLDQNFNEMLQEVTNDTIVVSHAGYGYWTERYGIKQVGISGISPTNEPSIRQIKDIIEFIEANEINYIIFEQNIPTSISETVRSQVGAEALWIHNLEALVQEDINNNEDYFSIMEKNIETLKKALK